MKVIDNEIGENGYSNFYFVQCNRLSRILVNNGFGDLKVKVGDVEISCIKSILMNGNDTLRKLLEDEKKDEVLELYEKCEINSFLEIEKYYSGGIMELNENNVCDILRFSVYYNDNRIMRICKRYLKKHLNDSIMIEIFSILHGLNMNQLNELRDLSEEYLKLNGYKYLNDERLLLKLNLKCLKFILNNEVLVIEDENWLLNRLMIWYRLVLKEGIEERQDEEEREEFVKLVKTQIHLNEIDIKEIEKDNMKELNELQISVNEYKNKHINVKIGKVKNVELKKIIHKYYIEIIKEGDIIIEEKDIKVLNIVEMKDDLIELLSNEDIRIVKIVLNIISGMKISEIIPNEIKSKALSRLLSEYNLSKRNITLKCLCSFVNNKKCLTTIEYLCGKEVLFHILNSINNENKELIKKYILECKLSVEEEEEMNKIILNKELLQELLIKEISSFSYHHSEYVFGINEEISIIPSFDGEKCEFSITPSLPSGILIDKENGIIHGKVDKWYEKKEYEVKCKNIKNEKKFKISLEFLLATFTELNKYKGISISNNRKTITNANGGYTHCYLNLKMERGIYHIKYKFHQNGSSNDHLCLGLSTNNTYSGDDIYSKSTTCNYWAENIANLDKTQYCHIGTVVNKNPNFNHGDGSIYEIIVNMNKREYWISHNNSSPVLLVKDLPSPLYPYVYIYYKDTSVEILSAYHN